MNLTPRETRLIKCLLVRPHSRKELGDLVGSLNVCDVKFRLVNKGLDIQCKRKSMIDRDGKKTMPGIYWLPEGEMEKARKLIGAAVTTPTADNQNDLAKQTDGDDSTTTH